MMHVHQVKDRDHDGWIMNVWQHQGQFYNIIYWLPIEWVEVSITQSLYSFPPPSWSKIWRKDITDVDKQRFELLCENPLVTFIANMI